MSTQPEPLTRAYDHLHHLHRAESRGDLDNSDMSSTWEPTLPGGETPRRSHGPSLEAKTATRPKADGGPMATQPEPLVTETTMVTRAEVREIARAEIAGAIRDLRQALAART
jgi:hypothetical protein